MTNAAPRSNRRIATRVSVIALTLLWHQVGLSAPPTVDASPASDPAPPAAAAFTTESVQDESVESPAAPARTPIHRPNPGENAPNDRAQPPSLTTSIAILGLILGGVYIALGWLRRRQGLASVRPDAIDLLASRRLDAHSTLHLVRIGPRVLAVGSSAGGTRTLAVIDDPQEIAVLISSSAGGASQETQSFRQRFQRRNTFDLTGSKPGSSPPASNTAFNAAERPA